MKCKKIIQKFLEKDDFNSLPPGLHFHMLFCSECRKEIMFLTGIFNSFRNNSPFEMERDLSGVIMERISRGNELTGFNVSAFKLFAVWMIILSGICLLPFNEEFLWLIKFFGIKLELPVNIVMGLLISIYSTFYIGIHMKDFKRLHNFFKEILKHYQ